MLEQFLNEFTQRFYDDAYPEVHRAVWTGLLWVLVIIRNSWTAWMVGR